MSSPHSSERLGRPPKKRRISKKQDLEHQASPSSSSEISAPDHRAAATKVKDNDKENDKPTSKYRIHIPQDDSLPEDVFFTQPPQRSNSPYRIENFHWQKPTKPPPISKGLSFDRERNMVLVGATSAEKAVSATIAPSHGPQDDTSHESHEVDSNFDLSDEDCFADIREDRVTLHTSTENPAIHGPSLSTNPSSHDLVNDVPLQPRNHSSILKQTTLFGTQPASNAFASSQTRRKWPMANRQEPPTHHEIDRQAMERWVYPINLGTIRDYQYTITATGLYHNTLVALPTGLGKTFIAATIMLNWYRWTKSAQIVFVAPTKPLVAQQVKACFEIAGIPRSQTSMLTGSHAPGLRAEDWRSKRVFFMTPQTFVNDLKSGIADPKRIVLIVIDEAHRAKGSYAYVEIVKFVKRFNESFRVLALTATPGGTIEGVQEVIDGLSISRVEIRTEDSLDIRHFVHARKTETVLFDNSQEMEMVMELFAKALQPSVDRLNGLNAYWSKDPLSLTPYGCNQALQRWMGSDAGRNAQGALKQMVIQTFKLLASLAQGTELLKYHGLGPFFHKVLSFRNEIHAGGKKGGKIANSINDSKHFQTMMSRLQIWINSSDFIGHPKLEYVQRVVLNHFLDAGDGRDGVDPSSTRIMVFAHFRQSAEEIVRILKRNEPMVRPHVFVGQSTVKDSEGMDQRKQLDIIDKFQKGVYNTLVATSIGEEGLDIGEVDLIICYDASASPIRMLQRMGRTGRKRAGNIVVTLMKGKEENSFLKAKDNYEKMQHEIASGAKFAFHEDTVRRIVPKDIQPVVDKRVIEIPIENTQADLPEPTKRGRPPKRPPKKFHMPDGVRTGFRKASRLDDDSDSESEADAKRCKLRQAELTPIPTLAEASMTFEEQDLFEQNYLEISGDVPELVTAPLLDRYPLLQQRLRPHKYIGHSSATQRLVRALGARGTGTALEALDPVDKQDIDDHAKRRSTYLSQQSQQGQQAASTLELDASMDGSTRTMEGNDSGLSSNTDKHQSRSNSSPHDGDDDEDDDESDEDDNGDETNILGSPESLQDTDDELPALEAMVASSRPEESKQGTRRGRRQQRIVEDESDD